MRDIRYLSPTSIKKFFDDKESFYMDYLADDRPDRMPQTQAMSVGSSFDAYIKSYLYKELKLGDDPRFELRALFEEQVEEHNRDWAWGAGQKCFDVYKKLGAISDLMIFLTDCEEPRFEFDLYGNVDLVTQTLHDPENIYTENKDNLSDTHVALRGKPDFYCHYKGFGILLDWKVNGFCSSRAPSPARGYLKMRYNDPGKADKSHKDCFPMKFKDSVMINGACKLEGGNKDWARQIGIYGWLMGEAIGGEFLTCIDQLVCCGGTVIGVAQHRSTLGIDYQLDLWNQVKEVWDCCKSGHFFKEMSLEDSQARCSVLDGNINRLVSLEDLAEGREL